MDTPPAIEAKQLGRRYGGRWAVRGLDLVVPRGGRLMLLGANGSGKTTLLRTLASSLAPSAGSFQIFGLPPLDALERVSLLSHADHHYDDLSGLDNLRLVARLLPRPGQDPLTAPQQLLEEVGLKRAMHEPVRGYSAGMRRRLALARLLWKDPALVLLDEPYGQLDTEGRAWMDRFLTRCVEQQKTIVVATHLAERAGQFLEDAIRLERGKIVWSGKARDAQSAAPDDGGAA